MWLRFLTEYVAKQAHVASGWEEQARLCLHISLTLKRIVMTNYFYIQ